MSKDKMHDDDDRRDRLHGDPSAAQQARATREGEATTEAEQGVLDARAALDQARGATPEDPDAVAAASKALAEAEQALALERNPPPPETKGPAEPTPPT
jgi:hypothetical protein